MAKRNGWITTSEGNHVFLKDGKIVDPPKNEKEKSPKGYDSRSDTPVKRAKDKIDSISKNSYGLKSTTPHTFTDKLQEAKETIPLVKRWRVDVHDVADYKNDKLFSTDFGSCVAIEPSGNIISVCKKEGDKTRGSQLLEYAVKNGGDRLDAFGEELYKFYTRNGFEPVSWTEFNEEYAPDEWKEAQRQGLDVKKEPVIFYKYTGKPYEEEYEKFISRVKAHNDYDAAMKERDDNI